MRNILDNTRVLSFATRSLIGPIAPAGRSGYCPTLLRVVFSIRYPIGAGPAAFPRELCRVLSAARITRKNGRLTN
ncbi:hypothetical protein [Nocardia sp. NPDC060255]|uniref:hypothetical protein n=1 Tax=Nocardia sp. NPDC060255 TaxID=3347085 RepID=UPI003669AEAA